MLSYADDVMEDSQLSKEIGKLVLNANHLQKARKYDQGKRYL